ncbi:MAG: Na/Pi cotransporter family protein [Tissierellia bacterium]|nr:Na/Pi cotransporter family protein [Tissierellia bacterium]
MTFFDFLTLIGGLALFLYGMDTMSTSLNNISGSQMKAIMTDLTSNRLKAVLLGAAVTALVQSSSGTTVIVVGLVNSAVMTLSQAVGVIMGANVGTTMTAWLLSLTSLSSENFFVQLLKPTSFSPVLAMVGVVMQMVAKSEKKIEIGRVMLGFAVLMFGMETMSAAMEPLAESPEFGKTLLLFSNPVLGILAGTIVTAVIQSSSASVGILQSLAATGIVTYSTAMPIIFGQNIGTCATALLSTIGAKRNAKRAAIIHLLFNMIGTVLFSAVFYLINYLRPFSFMSEYINAVGIAIIHTTFNILTTIVLLPQAKRLEELAIRLIPFTQEDYEERDEEFQKLDDRLLETPSIALSQTFDLSVAMLEYAREALFLSVSLVDAYDQKKYQRVRSLESRVDRYEDRLGSYLVHIGNRTLIEKDSKKLNIILHSLNDIERIADHAKNISEAANEMQEKQFIFSQQAREELRVYGQAVLDMVDKTIEIYIDDDVIGASRIEPLEDVIDYLNDEMKLRHVKRIRKGTCSIELGFVLMEITTSLERVADHCSNIAVSIITVNTDTFESHQYLNKVAKDDEAFLKEYRFNREKYKLPMKKEFVKKREVKEVEIEKVPESPLTAAEGDGLSPN